MALSIRQATPSDIPAIEALYGGRKVGPELSWLFTNPEHPSELNAFVAVESVDTIVGVVGYVKSSYTFQGRIFDGVTPMSWKIADGYKGFAGVQLLKKVYALGGFGIAIGGSKAARDMYPIYKLQYQDEIYAYIKVFRPVRHFLSLRNALAKRAANTLLLLGSWFKCARVTRPGIRLQPISADQYSPIDLDPEVFQKIVGQPYLAWLLACPNVQARAYRILRDQKMAGLAVLYIQPFGMGIKRGRIVYLSHLGNDSADWVSAISLLHRELKVAGCASVSAIGLHPGAKIAFEKAGYTHFRRKDKPFYIKDPDGALEGIQARQWHIQYTEGDKAYRSI